jgi:hypothetical protein
MEKRPMLALPQPLLPIVKFFTQSLASQRDDGEAWLRDPLSHPTVAAMSVDQLGDLPAAELRARVRC